MSIPLPATLVIQRKSGRRGDFNVGELTNELGKFDVKDALIEEFEPGTYTGTCILVAIEPDCFTWKGRAFFRIRAILEAFYVDEVAAEGSAPVPAPPPEPDPADQPAKEEAIVSAQASPDRIAGVTGARPRPARLKPSAASANDLSRPAANEGAEASASSAQTSDETHGGPADDDQNPDQLLFGAELYELLAHRVPIKLDPTVDRVQFRLQRDRLKDLGYTFEPKIQTWKMAA